MISSRCNLLDYELSLGKLTSGLQGRKEGKRYPSLFCEQQSPCRLYSRFVSCVPHAPAHSTDQYALSPLHIHHPSSKVFLPSLPCSTSSSSSPPLTATWLPLLSACTSVGRLLATFFHMPRSEGGTHCYRRQGKWQVQILKIAESHKIAPEPTAKADQFSAFFCVTVVTLTLGCIAAYM